MSSQRGGAGVPVSSRKRAYSATETSKRSSRNGSTAILRPASVESDGPSAGG